MLSAMFIFMVLWNEKDRLVPLFAFVMMAKVTFFGNSFEGLFPPHGKWSGSQGMEFVGIASPPLKR
jgi:hypothetical protein